MRRASLGRATCSPGSPSDAEVTARWIGAAALVLLGGVVGLAGAFVQAQRIGLDLPWGAGTFPWGVPLVWIALVAAIRGGGWAIGTRWGCWAVLGGWLVATVVLSAESPSGDLALSGGTRQLTYLLGGVILGSAAATLTVGKTGSRAGNR